MDLSKLRVYVTHERGKTYIGPVLVLDDGDERIIIRTDGDPDWLGEGARRLLKAAEQLAEAIAETAVAR